MKLYVVFSIAIPNDGLNCLASKINGVYIDEKKAQIKNKIINDSSLSNIYGLKCNIYNKIIPYEINANESQLHNEIYVIISTAIPIEKGQKPLQINIEKIFFNNSEAIKYYSSICEKTLKIKDIECQIHANIVPCKVILQ